MEKIALTVLSYGAGQDTTYFLHRIATDPAFREKHVSGRLLVVGSDTGDEHDHTYKVVEHVKQVCVANNVEFYWVTPDMGFHARTWQSLTGQYKLNRTIGSAAFKQACTDKLKIYVVYNFIESWIKKNYGYTSTKKKAYHEFLRDHGAIRVILGFAKNEERRCSEGFPTVWQNAVLRKYFPLISDGTDRQATIDYNETNLPLKVFPSNCKRCFYQSLQEILWLYRFCPADFWEWVEMERQKIERFAALGVEKNYGVYGKTLLEDKLAEAIKLYGHWSDEELNEYKYSHGHCIKSKY